MRALLVSNPSATRVTAAERRVVERALEATFELETVSTNRRGHAADLAREAASEGTKAVLVYGGDGTINEVVNGLITDSPTDIMLGLLPGGGTNVLARTLGYPNDLVEATGRLLGLIERSSVRRINVGRLEADDIRRVFTFAAGLGLDAEMVRRVEIAGKRAKLGDLAFIRQALPSLLAVRRAERPSLSIQTPDGPVDAWWALLCQSDPLTFLGSLPLRACPEAEHDRLLHLAAGRSVGIARTTNWIRQALGAARQIRHPDYLYLRDVAVCEIASRDPVALQADGEYLGHVHSLRATSIAQALPVYA